MRVGFVCETEMADVVRAVDRLRQGPQHHGFDQMRIGTFMNLREQFRIMQRLRLVAALQAQAQFAEERTQIGELFRRRAGVHAIQRGHFVLLKKPRGGDIGRNHTFFDELVRVVANDRHNGFDLAIRAEDNARFRGIEIDGAAFLARHA